MEPSIPRPAPAANPAPRSPAAGWLRTAGAVLGAVVLSSASLVVAGCAGRPDAERAAEEAARRTVALEGSIDPVRAAFNAHRGSPRLIAVLSSSCPRCREGAVAVAGPLLEARPDLRVTLIWTRVLPYDLGARKRIESFYDPGRITHFTDPNQAAARAIAAALGRTEGELAYDVFLLFDLDAEWAAAMPEPTAWFHQRRDFDPERYRTEAALERAIIEAAGAL